MEHTRKKLNGKSSQSICYVSLDLWEDLGLETQDHLLDLHDDYKTHTHVWQHCVVAKEQTGNMQTRTAKGAAHRMHGYNSSIYHHTNSGNGNDTGPHPTSHCHTNGSEEGTPKAVSQRHLELLQTNDKAYRDENGRQSHKDDEHGVR